jgi:hypothetical protein
METFRGQRKISLALCLILLPAASRSQSAAPAAPTSTPTIRQVWQRSQPSPPVGAGLHWSYESVARGASLGEPAATLPAQAPWYAGTPAPLAWQPSLSAWSSPDGHAALVSAGAVTEDLSDTRVPLVRWRNPTAGGVTVALSGVLSLNWKSKADAPLLQPIDFILMLQRPDGSTTPLLLADRKATHPRTAAKPAEHDDPRIPVDLPAVQVPAGGSIFYTIQYEDAAMQPGSVALDDSDLTITLKALSATPLPKDDHAVTTVNETVNVEVLANDQWAPQTLPEVSIATRPAHGKATVRADQSIDYAPAPGFVGTDTISYRLNDGSSTALAKVSITINQPEHLYVSTRGSDANSGTSWATALATLEGARDKLRAFHPSSPTKAIEVVLDDGIYRLDHTLQLDAADSGTSQYPVVYRARHPLAASISGGEPLHLAWRPYPAIHGAYVADLSASGLSHAALEAVHTLIVNGQRAVRAREPQVGFYSIVGADPDVKHPYNKTNTFTFGDTNGRPDIDAAWPNLRNAEIVSYANWTEGRMRIASVDATSHQVHIQGALQHAWANDYLADYGAWRDAKNNKTGTTDGTVRYYIENVLQGVEAPGSWYLDATAGKLYYRPRAGESIATSTFVIPVVNELIHMTGTAEVRFEGIVFRDTDWTMPEAGQQGDQAGIFITTPAAITLSQTTGITLANDRITDTGGGYGVHIKMGSTKNAVVDSEFVDNGGGGVMIGGNPDIENKRKSYIGDNRVTLNTIRDNNAVWRESTAVCASRSGYNRINANTVANMSYSGIDIGWFDSDPMAQGHNQINRNTITHFGITLSDQAGIYVLGVQPGTTIMGNHISDGTWGPNHLHHMGVKKPNGDRTSDDGPLAGIYTDETSSGEVVMGNTIWDTNEGIFFHQSRDQIVVSNVLVDVGPRSAFFVGNAQGSVNAGPLWMGSNVTAWTGAQTVHYADGYLHTNPWFRMDDDVISYGRAVEESPEIYGVAGLEAKGRENHVVVTASPLFVDAAAKNYRIAASAASLVKKQGFAAGWLLEGVGSKGR